MKFKLILILLSLNLASLAQDVSRDIIKKNKVYKCTEYNALDSVNYFKEYPNGFYKIYDYKGCKIEQNSYEYYDKKECEFKVYYLYDDNEREIMWMWYEPNSIVPISRVVINNYDSAGKLIGGKDFHPYNKVSTNNFNDSMHLREDSIITMNSNKKTITYYGFYGKPRKDTIYIKTRFYNSNRLDSGKTISHNEPWCKYSSFKFVYKDSTLIELVEIEDRYGDNHRNIHRTYYSENGLPNAIYEDDWDVKNKSWKKSLMKFKYLFRH
jgi:hypothetical protein